MQRRLRHHPLQHLGRERLQLRPGAARELPSLIEAPREGVGSVPGGCENEAARHAVGDWWVERVLGGESSPPPSFTRPAIWYARLGGMVNCQVRDEWLVAILLRKIETQAGESQSSIYDHSHIVAPCGYSSPRANNIKPRNKRRNN